MWSHGPGRQYEDSIEMGGDRAGFWKTGLKLLTDAMSCPKILQPVAVKVSISLLQPPIYIQATGHTFKWFVDSSFIPVIFLMCRGYFLWLRWKICCILPCILVLLLLLLLLLLQPLLLLTSWTSILTKSTWHSTLWTCRILTLWSQKLNNALFTGLCIMLLLFHSKIFVASLLAHGVVSALIHGDLHSNT